MDAWNQLINTALLGSGKGEGTDLLSALPGMEDAQQAIQERGDDAETRLLETTALLYTYRRCGALPRAETTPMTVAEAETKPYCSAQANRVLKDILLSGSTGLLRLWLERCDAAGQVAAPDAIVSLLDEAQKHKALRPLVVSCCGKRGEWLGRTVDFNWEFLSAPTATDEAERWSTGSTEERRAVLESIRATDPAAARALLEGVWKQEKADIRETLLQAMETGLSEEDVQFLESIITDKSKRVQALAYDLLMRIPDNSIVREMEEALRKSVRLQTTKKMLGLVSWTSLEITLPKALSKQLQEVIGKNPTNKVLSEEEFALVTMIGFMQPGFWDAHLGVAPSQVLELFYEAVRDDRHFYREAFQKAAIRHHDQAWARVLSKDTASFQTGLALLPLLSETDQQAHLTETVKGHPDVVIDYYSEADREWDVRLASTLMSYIALHPYQYHKGFLNPRAHLIPVNLLARLDDFTPPAPVNAKDYSRQYAVQTWQGSTRPHLQTLLEMKQQLLNAFN